MPSPILPQDWRFLSEARSATESRGDQVAEASRMKVLREEIRSSVPPQDDDQLSIGSTVRFMLTLFPRQSAISFDSGEKVLSFRLDGRVFLTRSLEFHCDHDTSFVHRNRRRLPRKQRHRECSSKANRKLVRGIGRRLLMEASFESLHATLSLEMEPLFPVHSYATSLA
ncbi:unnamed protein product [Protopolystoma xenopodis]|uniref:Uncharacterized protein n=1 Tax=Protopolystoma xenopodis TaxID=117903 RepID=A0A3S4ZB67_9PLAT|nr:unnamed protein product [Protopolystoma xenopodis]